MDVVCLPLRSITHRENELCTDQKDACKTQNDEYNQAYSMAERVKFGISQGTRDEVEGKVEVRLFTSAVLEGSVSGPARTREKYVKARLTSW